MKSPSNKNMIFSLISQALQKLVLLVVSSLLSNSLSLNEYGRFAYARSFTNFLDTSISASLYPIIVKEMRRSAKNYASYFSIILPVTNRFLVISAAIFFFIIYIDEFSWIEICGLYFMSVCVFFSGLSSNVLYGLMEFRLPAISSFMSSLLVLGVYFGLFDIDFLSGVILIGLFYGIDFFLKFTLFKFLRSAEVGIASGKISKKTSLSNNGDETKTGGSFSIALISGLVNALVFLYYRHFFTELPSGLEVLASIDVGFQLMVGGYMVLNAAILSLFSDVNASYSAKVAREKITDILPKIILLTLFIFAALLFLSKYYYLYLFPKAEIRYFLPLIASLPVYSLCLVLNRYIVFLGKQLYILLGGLVSGAVGILFLQYYSFSLENIGVIYFLYYLVSSLFFLVCIWLYQRNVFSTN
jgi:O-antigen/teichoic acid export membrane protein